ncbi:MAG: class I SAM-dependent methyltransferase [Myxococcales bacterium]|nr:class I SAM-dependent methyltransferase [Myxococcales bacterium]
MPAFARGSGLLSGATASVYDALAAAYDEDERRMAWSRPVDLGLLFSFAKMVTERQGSGVVGDLGCGPGHTTKILAELGLRMTGIDASSAMIARARANLPGATLAVGTLLHLPAVDASWAGAVALGALWHAAAAERRTTLAEVARVIQPGGTFLYSFVTSGPRQPADSVYFLERWLGVEVNLELHLLSVKAAATEVVSAGFEVIAATQREPLPHELPLRRGFLLARRR